MDASSSKKIDNPMAKYADGTNATPDVADQLPDEIVTTDLGDAATDSVDAQGGTAARAEREAEQIKFLQTVKKDTNFIFLFGAAQRGKTVITSSIVNFLSEARASQGQVRPFLLNLRATTDEGAALFRRIRRAHAEQRFPERSVLSPNGEPIYVTLKFVPDKALDAPDLPMTFLEMPGDTLAEVDSPTGVGSLPATINAFLKVDGLKPAFILVTAPETAAADDQLMASFIDYIYDVDRRFEVSKFLLLVTKWDTYEGQLSPSEFVAENMRLTNSKLFDPKHSVAPFSIGDVATVDGKPFLKRFEPSYAKAVTNWLYMEFTGKALYRRSFWKKVLDSFRRFG